MADAYDPTPPKVTPQPGLVKTIGVFNILFGGLLLLCGMGCLNPALQGLARQQPPRFDPKEAQKVLDEIHRQRIAELQQQEQAASTPKEKARIKEEREKAEANPPKFDAKKIDVATINEGIAWFTRYVWADVITGPLLNLLLLISGVGLLMRQNWARVLAIATAFLKIVRLVALCVLLIGFVVPRGGKALDALAGSEMGQEFFKQAMEQQKARGAVQAGPQPTPEIMAQYLQSFGNVYAILLPCLGSIYPLIVLVLLTRPGARAATRARDDEEPQADPAFGP
jgi:hypothetical protein